MAYKMRVVLEETEGTNPDYPKGKSIFPLARLDCGHTIIDARRNNYMNERANQISALAEALGKTRKVRCHKCGGA